MLFAFLATEYITVVQPPFVFSPLSFRKGALTQTNRKSSLCLSYLEEQLTKLKLEARDNGQVKNKQREAAVGYEGE